MAHPTRPPAPPTLAWRRPLMLALALALVGSVLLWWALQWHWLWPAATSIVAVFVACAVRWWPAAQPDRHGREAERQRMAMAQALHQRGDLERAYALYRQLPSSAQLHDELCQLALEHERRRELGRALRAFKHVLKRDAAHAVAREGAARVGQLHEALQTLKRPVPPELATAPHQGSARHTAAVTAPQAAAAPAPIAPPAAEPPHADDAPATLLAAGASLGPYRVERLLGRGAMGAVYLAQEPASGAQLAIKTLALGQEFDGMALAEARRRFFREARAAGQLQHPHIVALRDSGETQGLAYIAMEYLAGYDLSSVARPGHLLPVDQVLAIGQAVAQALDYAHMHHVIHRDIKPANLLFDTQHGVVKVADFGIARITDGQKTRTGLVLGTPSFMPPEQLLGKALDGRADLYALGVTLFQLLTGELPLRGASMAALMQAITQTPAPDVRSLRPELPEAVAQIVARLLAKAREQRFQTGAQLAQALRACAPDAPAAGMLQDNPEAPPPPGGYDAHPGLSQDVTNGEAAGFPSTIIQEPPAAAPAARGGSVP